MRLRCLGVAICLVVWLGSTPAVAQSLSDRVEHVRQKRAAAAEQPTDDAALVAELETKIATRISVDFKQRPLREAFNDWSAMTGVPLVIDWRAMWVEGIDDELPVDLELQDVSAGRVLLYLMDIASEDVRFIGQIEPWGMWVRTRERASRDVETRLYDVRDLVMEVPHFDDAPRLGLEEALSSGGGSGGILVEGMDRDEDRQLTKQERGDRLAEMVRQLIEPDLWQENGGEHSRIRYRQGMLIVRAPAFVHARIGRPAVSGGRNR